MVLKTPHPLPVDSLLRTALYQLDTSVLCLTCPCAQILEGASCPVRELIVSLQYVNVGPNTMFRV